MESEPRQVSGHILCWYTCLFFNLCIIIFGISLLIGCIYLMAKTGKANSISILFLIVGLFIIGMALVLFLCSKHSPTILVIYQIMQVIVFLVIFILDMCIVFMFDALIDFMTKHLKDSEEDIKIIREAVEANLKFTQIFGFTILGVIVVYFNVVS